MHKDVYMHLMEHIVYLIITPSDLKIALDHRVKIDETTASSYGGTRIL